MCVHEEEGWSSRGTLCVVKEENTVAGVFTLDSDDPQASQYAKAYHPESASRRGGGSMSAGRSPPSVNQQGCVGC